MNAYEELLKEYRKYVVIAAQMQTKPLENIGQKQDRPIMCAYWEGRADGINRAIVLLGFEKAMRHTRADIESEVQRLRAKEHNK